MRFTKAHGLGNDFILIDARFCMPRDLGALARRMCDCKTGVGADGLLLIVPSEKADIGMRIINSDGSSAEMCGNGIRCFAKYCYERGIVTSGSFTVETLAGVMRPELLLADGAVAGVCVDMGKPSFARDSIPMLGEGECIDAPLEVDGKTLEVSALLMGVPHTVLFVENAADPAWMLLGAKIEPHPAFPRHTNVNFAELVGPNALRVRTYERGCGPTLACGTGACAVAVAAAKSGRTDRSVAVELALGKLHILWEDDGSVKMTGPAELVFDGEYFDA
ncbi:MAG: diaminopimelate epimerase [Bacillota bacterium]